VCVCVCRSQNPFVLIHPGLSLQQRRFTQPDSDAVLASHRNTEVIGGQEEDLSTSSLTGASSGQTA